MKSREDYLKVCRESNQELLQNGRSLVQYVRTKHGKPRGVVVAFRDITSGVIRIGWSLCNKRDKFDKDIGKYQASQRASYMYGTQYEVIPHTIAPVYETVRQRAELFFNKKVEAAVV
jgi:hypothetical protein